MSDQVTEQISDDDLIVAKCSHCGFVSEHDRDELFDEGQGWFNCPDCLDECHVDPYTVL